MIKIINGKSDSSNFYNSKSNEILLTKAMAILVASKYGSRENTYKNISAYCNEFYNKMKSGSYELIIDTEEEYTDDIRSINIISVSLVMLRDKTIYLIEFGVIMPLTYRTVMLNQIYLSRAIETIKIKYKNYVVKAKQLKDYIQMEE